MLQSLGSQRIGHNLGTEQQRQHLYQCTFINSCMVKTFALEVIWEEMETCFFKDIGYFCAKLSQVTCPYILARHIMIKLKSF